MSNLFATNNGLTTGTCSTEGTACNVARCISLAVAGDTIWLLDGTYRGSGNLIFIANKSGTGSGTAYSPSGTPNPITIKAKNEGLVTFDGQFANKPAWLQGSSWWVLEGFNTKNGSDAIIYLQPSATAGSNNNILRKIVFWDALMASAGSVTTETNFNGTIGCSGNLFEDMAGFGTGGRVFSIGYGSPAGTPYNLGRRIWTRYEGVTDQVYIESITLNYGKWQGAVCENCLATITNESLPQNYFLTTGGVKQTGDCLPSPDQCKNPKLSGFSTCSKCLLDCKSCGTGVQMTNYGIFNQLRNQGGILDLGDGFFNDKAQAYGSLAYVHKVWGNTPFGSWSSGNIPHVVSMGDQQLTLQHIFSYISPNRAAVGNDPGFSQANNIQAFGVTNLSPPPLGPVGGTVTHVTSASTIGNSFGGNLVTSDVQTTTTYSGIRPVLTSTQNPFTGSTGAQLCYRWVNRTITTTPLWPWPMNDRILAATASAGNAISNMVLNGLNPCGPSAANCTGVLGHTRLATDVTADIEAIFGTIPDQCRGASSGGNTVPPYPTTTAFPSTPILDSFGGTGALSGWTTMVGNGFQRVNGVATPVNGFAHVIYDTLFGPSQEAYVTFSEVIVNGNAGTVLDFGVIDEANRYAVGVLRGVGTGDDQIKVSQFIGSFQTDITPNINLGVDIKIGDKVGVKVLGTTLTLYYYTGATWYLVATALLPTALPAQSKIGMAGYEPVALDDFGGGTVPNTTPILSVTPTTLTYAMTVGDAPQSQTITIANPGANQPMPWSVTDNQTWISVSPTSASEIGTSSVTVDITDLIPGTYGGTVTVTAPAASNSPTLIPVSLTVSAPVPIATPSISPSQAIHKIHRRKWGGWF
jgi:hypothetical protein